MLIGEIYLGEISLDTLDRAGIVLSSMTLPNGTITYSFLRSDHSIYANYLTKMQAEGIIKMLLEVVE